MRECEIPELNLQGRPEVENPRACDRIDFNGLPLPQQGVESVEKGLGVHFGAELVS